MYRETGIGPLAAARDRCNRNGARGSCELSEFLEVLGIDRHTEPEAHKHRALACAWALEALHELMAKL